MEQVDQTKTYANNIFELVLMIVFTPITFVRVFFRPKWITGYVHSQMALEDKKAWERHSAPMLLWLLTGVFPYFAFIHFITEGYADKEIIQVYRSMSWYAILGSLAAYLVALPLSCAFVVHLFKYKSIDKTSFKSSFYIQCYCFAVVQFLYLPGFFCIFTEDRTWLAVGVSFMLISIFWFLYTEYHIIKSELQAGFLKSVLVFVVMYFVSLFFVSISTGLFFLMNMSAIGDFVDVTMGDLAPDSLQTDTIYVDPDINNP